MKKTRPRWPVPISWSLIVTKIWIFMTFFPPRGCVIFCCTVLFFFYQSWSWSLKSLGVKLEPALNRSRLSISDCATQKKHISNFLQKRSYNIFVIKCPNKLIKTNTNTFFFNFAFWKQAIASADLKAIWFSQRFLQYWTHKVISRPGKARGFSTNTFVII